MLEVSFTGWGNSWYVLIPGVDVHKQNVIQCGPDEVTGVFRLKPEDEAEYRRTKSFYHVKTMQPLLSPGSTFTKLVEERLIPKIDADFVNFDVKRYREVYSPIPRKNVEVEVKNSFKVIEPETLAEHATVGRESAAMHSNRSNDLRTLIMASEKFWANADRDDNTTWPYNDDVEQWLKGKGFSNRLAEMGATVIRPEWAPTGRRSAK